MEDNRYTAAMLYDLYGGLLSEKQRQYWDLHYNQDFSLGEIAELKGVSRQAVHDTLSRSLQALQHTEDCVGAVALTERCRIAAEKLNAVIGKTDGTVQETLKEAAQLLNMEASDGI